MAAMAFTVAEMEAEHGHFGACFERQQVELLHALTEPRAADRALAAWCELAELLLAHLRFEDEHLIPLFAARVQPPPRGCSAELLNAEHRKLEKLLTELGPALQAHLAERREDPVALLQLLEQQRTLREVLEHHDQRERAAFFPALEEILDEEDREQLGRLRASQLG